MEEGLSPLARARTLIANRIAAPWICRRPLCPDFAAGNGLQWLECSRCLCTSNMPMVCAVACSETLVNLGRRRTARGEAMACGTLANSGGEQAAEGQTARLKLGLAAKL